MLSDAMHPDWDLHICVYFAGVLLSAVVTGNAIKEKNQPMKNP